MIGVLHICNAFKNHSTLHNISEILKKWLVWCHGFFLTLVYQCFDGVANTLTMVYEQNPKNIFNRHNLNRYVVVVTEMS